MVLTRGQARPGLNTMLEVSGLVLSLPGIEVMGLGFNPKP